MQPLMLLRTVFSHSELALYPTSLEVVSGDYELESWDPDADVNAKALQPPYTAFHETNRLLKNVAALSIPLLITSLPNLRKIDLFVAYSPYLLEAISQIVKASYKPLSNLRQLLAFSMLTEARIFALYDICYEVSLVILLAMIPFVRKLEVLKIYQSAPFVCPHPHYSLT